MLMKSSVATALFGLHALATPVFAAEHPAPPLLSWSTVVNNNYAIPGTYPPRTFNSYNEPSVNAYGLVVFRARSRGGGPLGMATQGIYTRDMSAPASAISRIFDRTTAVPYPNNLGTTFGEPPSFPRIDRWGKTIVTRANHPPVWSYTPSDATGANHAGTSGIYANPYGELVTGASKLGAVPGFQFFAVPGFDMPIFFDVFPGTPAVTNGATLVFKGNFTAQGIAGTGAFFRVIDNAPAGGTNPVLAIASTWDTLIPGTDLTFGSVSPPSAVRSQAVFAAFDDEESPSLGGIYLAPLMPNPPLIPLVMVGSQVPGEGDSAKFSHFGEGLSFDGRNVAFWGAWGNETRTVRLYCPSEGNKARIAYCNRTGQFADDPVTGEIRGDSNSICDGTNGRCYQEVQVPVNQGIFAYNTDSRRVTAVAKTGNDFTDFLFWQYSGMVPGMSEGSGESDGEPVRWRSSAFVAASGRGTPPFNTAFKAMKKDAKGGDVVGIYLGWKGVTGALTVLETAMAGQKLDPMAPPGSVLTEVGLEREGFNNGWLVINARMGVEGGSEEEGMAGIYLSRVPALAE